MQHKILFTHNTAMWYRIPFFKSISEIYDLDLVFTHMDVISDIYETDVDDSIKGLEDVNYTILKNRYGFAQGLVSKLFTDYEVVIGGSWDSPQELVETILIYIIARLRRKKLVIWREDWDWNKNPSFADRILNSVISFISKRADAILVPGSIHKSYFKDSLGVSEEKIHIMPNVSNISGNVSRDSVNSDTNTILYVGRLIKRKGVIYLLEAFNKLKDDVCDAKLIIIGSGEESEKLEKYVTDEDIHDVTFTGKIDNEKLKEYYQKSSIVVVPSITEEMADPWVFVLNEAMYYSNAIIATTAVGAAYDMIIDNGYIVDEKDSNALYHALKKVLIDDDIEALKENSRQIINEKYQYKNMVDAFKETIDYVLK